MRVTDIVSIGLATLTGLSGLYAAATAAGVPDAIDAVFPGKGKSTLASIALVSAAAAMILRIVSVPKGAPSTALTADAVFVPEGTKVVSSQTASIPITPSRPGV